MVGVPLALLALCVVIWLVLGRALARLDRIRAEVDALGHDQLDRRLPDDGRRDEVGRLVTTMNRMLSRVDSSVQRQRRFVADVSHDLQGPLTAQRLSLELVLASPEPVDKAILRDDVLGATGQMERLVGDLLVLASVDEGARAADGSPWTSTRSCSRKRRGRPGAASVVIGTSHVSAGPVHGNPGELRRIVRNLLDNAVLHARSRVELRVHLSDGQVTLDVVDDGPGVPENEREAHLPTVPPRGPCANAGHGGHRSSGSRSRGAWRKAPEEQVEVVDAQEPGAVFRLTLPAL